MLISRQDARAQRSLNELGAFAAWREKDRTRPEQRLPHGGITQQRPVSAENRPSPGAQYLPPEPQKSRGSCSPGQARAPKKRRVPQAEIGTNLRDSRGNWRQNGGSADQVRLVSARSLCLPRCPPLQFSCSRIPGHNWPGPGLSVYGCVTALRY